MRNLLTFAPRLASRLAPGLAALAVVAACESGPGAAKEPPILTVTSPARSLIQDHAGQITVSGTVEPNAKGDPIEKVLVNNVEATLLPDGSFHALIDLGIGASLIETVARDANGTTVSDTRAVQAGPLRPIGTNVDHAVTAAMSADAFAKISAAAGPILKGVNMAQLLAPLQPMVDVGGSLASFQLTVSDVKFSDIKISLAPVQGGLAFSAEITKLDVPGHMDFAGTLVPDGTTTVRVTADKVTVAGTLSVTPAGMAGFATKLNNPAVHLTGLHLDASGGIPGAILDLFDLDSVMQFVVSKGAELFMGPLVNLALGALGGPQQLDVLGKKLDLQVAPSAVAFTAAGAVLGMNMKALLAGSERSPGFLYTDNLAPAMDAGYGFQLGLSDDLVNELFAEIHAIGLLNLSLPNDVGSFDTAQVQMTMPPVLSADAANGELRIVLGDMFATFTRKGTPVGKAAINAKVGLKIAPVAGGGSIALQLGTPEIHVDTLDDIANASGLADKDLESGVAACIGSQIDAITKLLVSIPLPAIAGLQFRNVAIGSDDGYVMMSAQL